MSSAPEMWPAQREAVEFCLRRPAAMLDMGMGCGKTRVAIEAIRRREVSRKLRMLDVDGIEHGYELLEEVADCIGDKGVKYGAYERFAVLLADLIEPEPERTCQDVEGGNFFRCSKCGCELMRFADGWKPLYMGEVRYCPNCGARVVEEEK